jgi:formate dehydrogenase iron-sulfur subunit
MAVQQTLEIRRSSASVWGSLSTLRPMATVSKFIDTSTCIGCKACEAACVEWNDLGRVTTEQAGSYQTLPTLHARFWNLIKFNEVSFDGGGFAWLMRKDQCMHCDEPGCLEACPAPGAIVQYTNGIVDVNPDQCIGCGYCESGCPFNVPRFSETTGKMSKCTLCVDRTSVGLEPACIKACPTGCLQFGTKDDMVAMGRKRVAQLQANGYKEAALYDPQGVNGTSVVTVLAYGNHPEWYGLPSDPHVPILVKLWKRVLRPLGGVAIFGAILGAIAHYTSFGPKKVAGADLEDVNLPPPSVPPREEAP